MMILHCKMVSEGGLTCLSASSLPLILQCPDTWTTNNSLPADKLATDAYMSRNVASRLPGLDRACKEQHAMTDNLVQRPVIGSQPLEDFT